MSELTADDLEVFRTAGDDDQIALALNAALRAARRHCGWHVSPVVEDDEVVIDGPDSRILNLPTRKLVELTSVEEDGVDLDLADLRWSAGGPPGLLDRPVSMRKVGRGWWSAEYQAITVVMTHGYTEEEAADWRYAVLSMTDRIALAAVGVSQESLIRKTVDDVTYAYANPYASLADESVGSVASILDDFCLPRLEFL